MAEDIYLFAQESQFLIVFKFLVVILRDCFKSIIGSKPSSTNCSSRVIISSMKNSSQAIFLPWAIAAQKGIISYNYTIYSQRSWPFVYWNRLIKMFSLDDSIVDWEDWLTFLAYFHWYLSCLCILYQRILSFFPLVSL